MKRGKDVIDFAPQSNKQPDYGLTFNWASRFQKKYLKNKVRVHVHFGTGQGEQFCAVFNGLTEIDLVEDIGIFTTVKSYCGFANSGMEIPVFVNVLNEVKGTKIIIPAIVRLQALNTCLSNCAYTPELNGLPLKKVILVASDVKAVSPIRPFAISENQLPDKVIKRAS